MFDFDENDCENRLVESLRKKVGDEGLHSLQEIEQYIDEQKSPIDYVHATTLFMRNNEEHLDIKVDLHGFSVNGATQYLNRLFQTLTLSDKDKIVKYKIDLNIGQGSHSSNYHKLKEVIKTIQKNFGINSSYEGGRVEFKIITKPKK